MADKSGIEWTDATWNPIRARNKKTGKVGWHCEHATTGCEFCYAEGFNKRLGTGLAFKPGHRKDIEIFLDEKMLTQPLRWKKPRKIFVCSMTDLFADFVSDEMLDKIFHVIALCPQHTFQVVTKRASRMCAYVSSLQPRWDSEAPAGMVPDVRAHAIANAISQWPLPNVWLGVSAERQQEWDERLEQLGATPVAVRFVSVEPMLGPIDVGNAFDQALPGGSPYKPIDWIICGGESGPKARPMHPDWARSLRDQCHESGVAFFFKQWGEWAPSTPEAARGNPRSGWRCLAGHPHVAKAAELYPAAGAAFMERVGKKRAGRALDGVEYDTMPEVAR